MFRRLCSAAPQGLPPSAIVVAKKRLHAVPYNGRFKPMARRITFALLCGAGFTALLSLMLHLSYVNLLASMLLVPGGMIQALPTGSDSTLGVLAANCAVYSVLIFVIATTVAGIRKRGESRRVNIWLAFPVGVLVILACVPTLDPLWPTGMSQLARQEAQLHEILPVGIDLEQARGVLRSQGIEFWEHVEKYDNVIFNRPEGSVSAASGETVISSQIWTKAGQFPCSYRIDVVLLFGKEQRLTKRSISRMRICP